MKKNKIIKNILNYNQFGLIVALIVLLIAAAVLTPAFFKFSSISAMFTNNSVYAILALGSLFVLLTGGIDISIGSILAVSGVTVAKVMVAYPKTPALILLLIGVAAGGVCGFINGFLVGKLKMVPMIVTLGTMYAFRGAAFVISDGTWTFTHQFTDGFMSIAQTRILGFNAIVWWVAGLFIVTALFLGFTKPGRRFYAIGTNKESAGLSGINEGNVKLFAYILCGIFAGLAGGLYAANQTLVNSDIGTGYEMTAIAICILGKVSITGGRGKADGVLLSAVLISVINYFLSLLPGFNIWQAALQGAIIILALIVNVVNGKMTFDRALKERGQRI